MVSHSKSPRKEGPGSRRASPRPAQPVTPEAFAMEEQIFNEIEQGYMRSQQLHDGQVAPVLVPAAAPAPGPTPNNDLAIDPALVDQAGAPKNDQAPPTQAGAPPGPRRNNSDNKQPNLLKLKQYLPTSYPKPKVGPPIKDGNVRRQILKFFRGLANGNQESADEEPQEPAAQQPGELVDQQPEKAADQQPEEPVEQQPENPASQGPEEPADQQHQEPAQDSAAQDPSEGGSPTPDRPVQRREIAPYLTPGNYYDRLPARIQVVIRTHFQTIAQSWGVLSLIQVLDEGIMPTIESFPTARPAGMRADDVRNWGVDMLEAIAKLAWNSQDETERDLVLELLTAIVRSRDTEYIWAILQLEDVQTAMDDRPESLPWDTAAILRRFDEAEQAQRDEDLPDSQNDEEVVPQPSPDKIASNDGSHNSLYELSATRYRNTRKRPSPDDESAPARPSKSRRRAIDIPSQDAAPQVPRPTFPSRRSRSRTRSAPTAAGRSAIARPAPLAPPPAPIRAPAHAPAPALTLNTLVSQIQIAPVGPQQQPERRVKKRKRPSWGSRCFRGRR